MMSEYTPDNWVVIKFTQQVKSGNTGYGRTEKVFYKVLGGWSGGYLDGDSWRLNSGIVDVEETTDSFIFIGGSGSRYICDKGQYQLRMNTVGIWKQMQEASEESSGDVKLEMMPEDTDWSALL
tara:strand:+ start:1081 stop:1449 length:369 start_codon:yes stop_codon:yes gene_type:complete